jgi:hypothetical protein
MPETNDPLAAIPSLEEILGTTAAPAPAPAASPAPAPAPAAGNDNADLIARIDEMQRQNAELMARLNTRQEPDHSAMAAAIAAAVKPAAAPAPKFDPLASMDAATRAKFSEFIDAGLAPVLNSMVDHSLRTQSDASAALAERFAAMEKKLAGFDNVAQATTQANRAVLDSSVRAANPDWDTIRTSPEWERNLQAKDPMTGMALGQLLDWRAKTDGPAEAVIAYNTALQNFRTQQNMAKPATVTAADLARPRTSAASPAPNTPTLNITAETTATEKAIADLLAKPGKSEKDMKALNLLYDRMRALAVSGAQAKQ